MELSTWIILPDILVIGVALGFVVFARAKHGPWGYLGLGGLAWAVTVGLKYLMASLVNPTVYQIIYVPDALAAPGSILFYLYVGLLTGLTEVLLIWLLLRYTRLGQVGWPQVLAFGVGFGAVEALLIGFSNLLTHVSALIASEPIPDAMLSGLLLLNNPLYGFASVVERFGTIFVHMFCCALLFYGATSGRARWLWLAFAIKSLDDAIVTFGQFWGIETLPKLWAIEVAILVLGCVALWGIGLIARRYTGGEQVRRAVPAMG